jgi:hypothetical protein
MEKRGRERENECVQHRAVTDDQRSEVIVTFEKPSSHLLHRLRDGYQIQ